LDLEELTCGLLFISRAQVLTSLTNADHWLGFARMNVLVSSLVFRVVAVSSLVSFGAQKVCLEDLGFSGLDWSDWCRSLLWKSSSSVKVLQQGPI
jgi:hypothetical protein